MAQILHDSLPQTMKPEKKNESVKVAKKIFKSKVTEIGYDSALAEAVKSLTAKKDG